MLWLWWITLHSPSFHQISQHLSKWDSRLWYYRSWGEKKCVFHETTKYSLTFVSRPWAWSARPGTNSKNEKWKFKWKPANSTSNLLPIKAGPLASPPFVDDAQTTRHHYTQNPKNTRFHSTIMTSNYYFNDWLICGCNYLYVTQSSFSKWFNIHSCPF